MSAGTGSNLCRHTFGTGLEIAQTIDFIGDFTMAQDGTRKNSTYHIHTHAHTHTERSERNGKSRVPPVPAVPRFSDWLLAQADRDDPIGDLAYDARRDPPSAPMWGVRELRDHIGRRHGDRAAIRALNEAAAEWQQCCDSATAGDRIAP